jgi:hypothetical protein
VNSLVLWPFVVAIVLIVVVWLIWMALAFHPALRDRYDHWARLRFHAELRWFHIHLVLALIIALLLTPLLLAGAYAVGYETAQRFDASYYANNYQFPGLKPAPQGAPLPPMVSPKALPATASIQIIHYPAVGDQGPIGSCAGWASAWDLSYEYRMTHLTTHPGIKFSPRCGYDAFSCTQSGCADNGSNVEGDLAPVPVKGVARYNIVPYGSNAPNAVPGLLPYAVEQAPGQCYVASNGNAYKIPLTVHDITPYSEGPGMTAITLMKQVLAGVGTADGKQHGVMVAFEVLHTYDNATYQPLIVPDGSASRGGHENVILAYDDTKLMPDGTVGAALVQNQWGTRWGMSGRAWLSYSYIARYSFGMSYITLGGTGHPNTATLKKLGPADGGHKPILSGITAAPPPSDFTPPTSPQASGWYVRGPIYAHDSGQDIAPLLNHNRWGIWPVYLLAVVMSESGINQFSQRLGYWPDVSFGYTQLIVQTLATYYSGCGGTDTALNRACARSYLFDGARSVDLGAHILFDDHAQTHVGYPQLWECFNAGFSCQSPYYSAFLTNYYIALTYATSSPGPGPRPTPKPAPKQFPHKAWYSWCVKHSHTACQSYHYHHKISWAGLVWLGYQGLKGVKGREVYTPRTRRMHHAYTTTRFVNGKIVQWNDFHRAGVYDVHGKLIGRR